MNVPRVYRGQMQPKGTSQERAWGNQREPTRNVSEPTGQPDFYLYLYFYLYFYFHFSCKPLRDHLIINWKKPPEENDSIPPLETTYTPLVFRIVQFCSESVQHLVSAMSYQFRSQSRRHGRGTTIATMTSTPDRTLHQQVHVHMNSKLQVEWDRGHLIV